MSSHCKNGGSPELQLSSFSFTVKKSLPVLGFWLVISYSKSILRILNENSLVMVTALIMIRWFVLRQFVFSICFALKHISVVSVSLKFLALGD